MGGGTQLKLDDCWHSRNRLHVNGCCDDGKHDSWGVSRRRDGAQYDSSGLQKRSGTTQTHCVLYTAVQILRDDFSQEPHEGEEQKNTTHQGEAHLGASGVSLMVGGQSL